MSDQYGEHSQPSHDTLATQTANTQVGTVESAPSIGESLKQAALYGGSLVTSYATYLYMSKAPGTTVAELLPHMATAYLMGMQVGSINSLTSHVAERYDLSPMLLKTARAVTSFTLITAEVAAAETLVSNGPSPVSISFGIAAALYSAIAHRVSRFFDGWK